MVQSGRAGSSTGLALLRRQRRSPRSYSQNETSCLHNTACSSFASGEAKFRSFEDKFPGRVLTVRKTGGTMRIAQISPLMEAVPPKFYGGTERIVAYLTDALVGLGHEVTLFASGDSSTTATLVAGWPQALRLDPTIRDHIAPLITMLETAAKRAGEFDVVHLHCDYLGYVALRRAGVPFLATLHGRLDLPELKPLYRAFCEVPVASISDAQRAPLSEAHYIATVPHGLPERLLLPGSGAGGYLAFLRRISPENAPDPAIPVAALAGMKVTS